MMACKFKIDEKSQNMRVWWSKMVLAQHFLYILLEAGEKLTKTSYLLLIG